MIKIYTVYKKSIYYQLNWFEKILFKLGGGKIDDTLVGYTQSFNLATLYLKSNYNYTDAYIKEMKFYKSEFDVFINNNGSKEIKKFETVNGDIFIFTVDNSTDIIYDK